MSNSKYNNSNANINKNSNDDESNKQDTNKLLETISLLENALNKEMNTKVIYQNENKDLTENRLPNIQNQLKLQEELLDKAMINLLIKDKESQLQPQVNRSYFREDIALKSQVDFYKNKCLTLKDELSLLKVNHDKEISKLKEQLTVEIEKNEVLINSMKDKDYQMTTLYSDVEKFSLQNNGLLEEIAILNNYISDLLYKKENQDFEIEYLRSEVSQLKSEYCYKSSQIKSNDENFNKLNILVKEYQSTLIDMEVTNYIFNVMRKGRVVDTKADIVFTKDKQHNFLVIINYLTSSITHDIFDIKECKVDPEDKEVFEFFYIKDSYSESFSSKETDIIIRVFMEMKEKAIKQSNQGKFDKDNLEKKKKLGKKLNNALDIFDW